MLGFPIKYDQIFGHTKLHLKTLSGHSNMKETRRVLGDLGKRRALVHSTIEPKHSDS